MLYPGGGGQAAGGGRQAAPAAAAAAAPQRECHCGFVATKPCHKIGQSSAGKPACDTYYCCLNCAQGEKNAVWEAHKAAHH